jgi:hypothetical protein
MQGGAQSHPDGSVTAFDAPEQKRAHVLESTGSEECKRELMTARLLQSEGNQKNQRRMPKLRWNQASP